MAQRRMISLKIIDTDNFLDMPSTSRLLYYDLCLRADDDGFVANFRKIIRMTGAQEDDLRILISKGYVIPFQTGVCVLRHWRIHNYIPRDRYQKTIYQQELAELLTAENGEYTRVGGDVPSLYTECIQNDDKPYTACIQNVSNMDTQVRLGKVRLGKASIVPGKFEAFYEAYPKKKGKQDALKAWAKIKPDEVDAIMESLSRHIKSHDWTKDGGKYIPHPATWLNGRRWEDEVKEADTVGTNSKRFKPGDKTADTDYTAIPDGWRILSSD